jgi:hypothetical protein
MLSSDAMNRVLRMARAQGYARTVLVGDIKQLDAVGAGAAFRALQDAGMPTALMSDIQRQTSQEGRDTVLAAISGDIARAMGGIKVVSEVGGEDRSSIRSGIAEKLAGTYSAMSVEDRANTGLIVLTNGMRLAVNSAIQHALKMSGEIGGGEVSVASLAPRNFTQAEAGEIGSYRTGDIVVAPVAAPRSNLKSNILYTVADIAQHDRKLTLTSPTRETVTLDLDHKNRAAQKLAVFKSESQNFTEGDRVKFRITDRAHGLVNSAQGVLTRAGTHEVTIDTETGAQLVIPLDSLAAKGMQLAYASTAHDFQGSTVDRVLLGMSSEEQLSTQKSFYVSLSRMRDQIHLVTDNIGKLAGRIASETGERVNALEALAEERERVQPEDRSSREDPTKSDDLRAPKSASAAAVKERDPQSEKTDPEASQEHNNDSANEERQRTLFDKLISEIEHSQKTRDERSR